MATALVLQEAGRRKEGGGSAGLVLPRILESPPVSRSPCVVLASSSITHPDLFVERCGVLVYLLPNRRCPVIFVESTISDALERTVGALTRCLATWPDNRSHSWM
jgi:hypothetical protein